jgi:aspartyl-tRNA(Asn)/glutamyl-tRNA(Gln) amidotransferase subunit C
MTEEITRDDFEHLVALAELELDPEEADLLLRQLNNQLKSISELAAFPLDTEVPIASHGIPYESGHVPPLRKDEWHPHPDPERILECAPEHEHGYIVVPEIPHADLP